MVVWGTLFPTTPIGIITIAAVYALHTLSLIFILGNNFLPHTDAMHNIPMMKF